MRKIAWIYLFLCVAETLYGQASDSRDPLALKYANTITAGDLSTYLQGRPLPGCEPGYFKGRAPDAGADEVR